ncbi:hypothetical protein MRQ86_37965 [Streptomyces sp. MMS21 TC-5]|uniref:DUF6153 family protein n=1 Tax=Streptomyces sp. MMS21 TC-5 TaxID=2925833 RepID=UPI001F602F96|nr:DUF6153 family protein [Streptomyces sp. MMS21 TC-5]MCI4085985.1 hypothetical protein [Streptomyces sp. MMS21 TC-5]
MHALGPAPARAAVPAAAHHASAVDHGAPAAGRSGGGCSHPDGGPGHSEHADATCAAAGIASAYTPPRSSRHWSAGPPCPRRTPPGPRPSTVPGRRPIWPNCSSCGSRAARTARPTRHPPCAAHPSSSVLPACPRTGHAEQGAAPP